MLLVSCHVVSFVLVVLEACAGFLHGNAGVLLFLGINHGVRPIRVNKNGVLAKSLDEKVVLRG